jgi:hypothetical protein
MFDETGPGPEEESTPTEEPTEIRTFDSEVKANVEFWKGTKWELSESEVRSKMEEIREKAEEKGMDWYFVMPKGIKVPEIFQMMKERYHYLNDSNINLHTISMPEISDETYAVATKFQQEPDKDSLGELAKSPSDWEKIPDQFMNIPTQLVADMRYFQETSRHLNEENTTISPRSREWSGSVPGVGTDLRSRLGDRRVVVSWYDTKVQLPDKGVRRVVNKESQ